jgi:hypothetical protein
MTTNTGFSLINEIKRYPGRFILAAVGFLIIVVVVLVAAFGNSPFGYHNMSTLQKSVSQQEQQDSGITPSTVTCVPTGTNTANCNITAPGQSITVNVIISPNGNSWVSE